MEREKLIKLLILLLGLIIIGPVALQFLPNPLTMDRIVEGLKKSDLGIVDISPVEPPTQESIAQISFRGENFYGSIYQYDNEGAIAKYAEMYKKDPGTAIVEAWGLAQSLGAAPSKNKPERVARRKMFLLVVQGDDKAVLDKVVTVFNSL